MHACMYVYVCIRMDVYVCTYVCMHVCICMHVRMYVCMCVWMDVCMYTVCMYVMVGQSGQKSGINVTIYLNIW